MVVRRILKSRPVRDYALITIGCVLTAWGLDAFLIPNRIAAGGVSGLATIIHHVVSDFLGFDIGVGLLTLLFNAVLLAVAFRVRGLGYAAKTVFGSIALGVFIDIFAQFTTPIAESDLLLASLYGGVVMGLGVGLVFKAGGNTGGTDIVAQLLARKMPLGVGQLMFGVDAVVILLAALVFGPMLAMYGAVAIFVCSIVIDTVLEGLSNEKAVFVISDEHDTIVQAVLNEMGRGATTFEATGAWTGQSRKMLFVVLSRNELDALKRIVGTVDPTAMVVISNVSEAIGEGFKEMRMTT